MPIENVLSTSRERIASGLLRNEAQVKSAIIIPILRALGWDDSDPTQYVPEYALAPIHRKGECHGVLKG